MGYLGEYKERYIGHSIDEQIRKKGASGGVVSSVLVKALEKGLIKGAMVIGMSKTEPWKPKVKLAKTKKEVLEAAGSKYTLIPINEIIEIINSTKEEIAIVGLPCHLKIIKNAQKAGKFKHVKYMIGLFCGYNQPYKATEFLLKKTKIKKKDVQSLEYRGGKYPGGFLVKSAKKTKFYPKYYYDIINLMFVPKGCLKCQDFTNEIADLSCGDTYGYPNSTAIISRTEKGKELLDIQEIEKKIISEKELIKMHWHNIKHKKIGDPITVKIARRGLKVFGKVVPFRILGLLAKTRRKIKRKIQK